MTHAKRILVALLVVLAMSLSAIPASADPGTTNGGAPIVDPLNVTWE